MSASVTTGTAASHPDPASPTAATPSFDVAAQRARTPGCATGHHFNAAGAALLANDTVEAVIDHLRAESLQGGYEAAKSAADDLAAVYAGTARLLGVAADEVALVESATAGWQRVVAALRLRPGDRVLAARSSYVSSALHLLSAERDSGVRVEVLPSGPDGATDLDALEGALRAGPAALVTAAHVPTSSGLVEPAAEIGALARAHGVPFLLDATQSLGQLPVDMAAIGCDLLIGTGRKFLRAPRGTGLLAVRRPLLERLAPQAPDVRGARWTAERTWELAPDARRFELWEAAHALRLGLGSALADLHALDPHSVFRYLAELASALRVRLAALPGVRVTDPPASGGAIVTFVVDGLDGGEVQRQLALRRVHLVAVPADHGRWDMDPRGLEKVVRASVHVYTDERDLDALVEGVAEIAAGAPRASASGKASAREAESPGTRKSLAPSASASASGTRPDPTPRHDAIVVGLGVHGSAALRRLAERGLDVLGLEQFAVGHALGSSHGATRMIRRAYPHPDWDGLVDTAYRAWAELEDSAKTQLVDVTGGLYAAPDGRPDPLRGPGCRQVGPEEAAGIFPGLRLPEGFSAVHDPRAGIIDARETLRAQLRLAERAGARIMDRTPVTDWKPDGDGVVVHTADGEARARRLVLCVGPWMPYQVPSLAAHLTTTRIVNAYFAADPGGPLGRAGLGSFSVDLPEGLLYGFPATDGRGLKAGLDSGPDWDPESARPAATEDELRLLARAVARVLPGAGPVTESLTCLYTMTADRRFLVGEVPGVPQALMASACSGHGFKFGPAIGAALADLVCGLPRPDLAFLSPARLVPGGAR
ncbi:N-methyl-L-tryptophan oxidase [Streptomyces pseudovenezuelae]|uniref:Cysteine desulfurase/selenocysteine lyase n=1 Tax=Streptomyces pseudovenezuelae TaxID=67350 RepID=A0ABT6LVW4_9ACTN|nr:N-methyl-L-tryptophan oxidase [Streptomyces pseudovenezuelae]MDH6220407.1 cysteine desulfurase/selenocysteine lyase [Streptomyces pseudovenezuelae]